ncbi:unnamed protein product [Parnassius apollo]|uniref:(apollo) hypothetical protein n=1 Tax=Parnassius apollo TaxID=110799 RepID=A0A8S3XPJ6_PARAO|nr:unnamed protein product [Parnassius apollo]
MSSSRPSGGRNFTDAELARYLNYDGVTSDSDGETEGSETEDYLEVEDSEQTDEDDEPMEHNVMRVCLVTAGVGDSAYLNRPYLLTPIINPVTEAEKRYNEAHIKTRNVIERTFGVWKRRFPVVALTLRLLLPKVQAIIIATAVLHNICRNHNLEEVSSEVELPTAEINEEVYFTEVQNVSERTSLINNYFR